MSNIYFTAKLWATLSPRINRETEQMVKTRKTGKPARTVTVRLTGFSAKER